MAKQSPETEMALMQRDIQYIRKSVDDLTTKMSTSFVEKAEVEPLKKSVENFEKTYVQKEDFTVVKNIVFGMVGLILVGFIGTVVRYFIPGQ